MKKKFVCIVSVLALGAIAVWNLKEQQVQVKDLASENVEALANINPLCPNGCESGGDICYCYGTHYMSKEHNWGD